MRKVTHYRIFIGSPTGLEAERAYFKQAIERFNSLHLRYEDVMFEAVGWDNVLPGAGRPQSIINLELEDCDYAIFVFHDRWGSASGDNQFVGTEEEWIIAERLFKCGKMIEVALYFKRVRPEGNKSPVSQIKKVLKFKRKIEREKRHLYREFDESEQFLHFVEAHLRAWIAKFREPSGYGDP